MTTTDLITEGERATLGLDRAVPGPLVEREIPRSLSRGRAIPAFEDTPAAEAPPVLAESPLSLGTACQGTLALEWAGSCLVVSATDDVPIQGKALSEGVVCRTPKAHIVEVEGVGRAAIKRPDGLVLVVSMGEGILRHLEWAIQCEAVRPLAEADVDLRPFLALVEDAWLRSEMEKRDRGPWSRVVALGLFRRFYLVTLGRESTRRAVADILSGVVPCHRTDQWVESLAPEQVETITSHLVSSAILLKQEIQELSDDYRPADEDWTIRWVAACHQRDDLEGVRWLFPKSQLVAEVLEDLDRFARRVTASFAPCVKPADHRLLLALSLDHEAWWVDPVRDPRDYDFLT